MDTQWERMELLIGAAGSKVLHNSAVIIFGVGGVGSFAVEALTRAGIGKISLVDPDVVCYSNLNRQLPALHSTVGEYKVAVLRERIKDINPKCQVEIFKEAYHKGNSEKFFLTSHDFVVDAIDSVGSKVDLIKQSIDSGIPIVSAMGAGNRLNFEGFRVGDISETFGCPLAKAVRRQLKKLGVEKGVTVVFSPEPTMEIKEGEEIGSISFVPPIVGMMMAGVVVNKILK
ncbi:MAG: tRNA threonylcarbamoyladenosine dehydratase [Bacillota bacterium]